MSIKDKYVLPFLELINSKQPLRSLEGYPAKYLDHLLSHQKYFVTIYADVLQKALDKSGKSKDDIILIDYGAGNGILGIFARFCGFGKVYINDMDPLFISAAGKLALILDQHIEGFIAGDIASVAQVFKLQQPDIIVGTDVIEHIYDLTDFFQRLSLINPDIISVFTTGSNPANFLKMRKLKRLQIKDELEGGDPADSVLFGAEGHRAFLEIRKDLIINHFNVTEQQALLLAKLTRGRTKNDILLAAERALTNGHMPVPPSHPTNTCNPLTGSWTERILTIKEYEQIYNAGGFRLNLTVGYYDTNRSFLKKQLFIILNQAIRFLGKTFAPYIILIGSKK